MKKKILCLMLLGALALTACGEAEGNNPPADTVAESSVTTEATEETTAEVTTTPATEITTTEAPKESAPATFDPDLAPFGEFADKFFIATNQEADKPTKDEVFEYLADKDYNYYSTCYLEFPLTFEEARERDSFYINSDAMFDYGTNTEKTYLWIRFENEKLVSFSYELGGVSEETLAEAKETFNGMIESGVLKMDDKTQMGYTPMKKIWNQYQVTYNDDVSSIGFFEIELDKVTGAFTLKFFLM